MGHVGVHASDVLGHSSTRQGKLERVCRVVGDLMLGHDIANCCPDCFEETETDVLWWCQTWPQTTGSESLVRPSQWQVLTACIIYGCSVASFLHRRRLRDSNVPPIFTVCVALGVLVGKCTGAGIDYIMLVHASWATCLAMIACVACPHIQSRLSK